MNDRIPNEVAKCEGKKADNPLFPLWHSECINCIRRMAIIKDHERQISPWVGHGPCPDKLEMEH